MSYRTPRFHSWTLTTARCLYNHPDWFWDSNWHNPGWQNTNLLHLWIVLEGQNYSLRRGAFFVLRCSEHQLGEQERDAPLKYWIATFRPNHTTTPLPARHRETLQLPVYDTLAAAMCESWQAERVDDAQHYLATILALIETEDASQGPAADPAVDAVCEAIRREPGSNWSLAVIASHCDCSPNQCIRRFRKHLGITPHRYVLSSRMELARTQLRFTGRTVADIAAECGYSDAFTFSRQFRQCEGVPPGQYRHEI